VRRVVEVRRVRDVTDSPRTERELALVKVNAPAGVRSEILEAAQVFRARPIDLTEKTVTLEVTGSPEKIDAFLNLVARHGVREVARTGSVVLLRGSATT
jgi:acetolactate synthase-1/3 small subunit